LICAGYVLEKWRIEGKYQVLKNQAGSRKIKNVKYKSQNDNVKLRGNHVALRNVKLKINPREAGIPKFFILIF